MTYRREDLLYLVGPRGYRVDQRTARDIPDILPFADTLPDEFAHSNACSQVRAHQRVRLVEGEKMNRHPRRLYEETFGRWRA